MRTATRTVLLLMALGLSVSSSRVRADVVYLTGGGVLRGTVISPPGGPESGAVTGAAAADGSTAAALNAPPAVPDADLVQPVPGDVRIQLLSGAEVTVASASVERIERRPVRFEEYEHRARKLPDTLDAHWDMAEWCRTNTLPAQRDAHLERVLEFDPEHRKAHYGLGHTFQDGHWMTREEYDQLKRDQGYVKYDGRWVPEEKLDDIRAREQRTQAELDWFPKVRVWLKQATGTHPSRAADGLANLRNIRSPDAVPALVQFLGESPSPDVRSMFLTLAEQIGGPRLAVPLAALAVHDEVLGLREQSLRMITEEQHELAQRYLISELRDPLNTVVRRSGNVLGRVGNEDAVPALIHALVTTHSYRIRVPVEGYSFGTDGSIPGGSWLPPDIEIGLRTGVYDSVQVVPLLGAQGRPKSCRSL